MFILGIPVCELSVWVVAFMYYLCWGRLCVCWVIVFVSAGFWVTVAGSPLILFHRLWVSCALNVFLAVCCMWLCVVGMTVCLDHVSRMVSLGDCVPMLCVRVSVHSLPG